MADNQKYVLKDEDDGSYYAGRTGIGPRFTKNLSEAKVFDTREEAAGAITHWSMGGCELKTLDEEKA